MVQPTTPPGVAPPPGPAAPAPTQPTTPPRRRRQPSRLVKLAPLGPTLLAVAIVILIGELMLWQASLPAFIAANLAAVLVVMVVIRRKTGRGRRDRGRRPGVRPAGPRGTHAAGRGGLRGLLGRMTGGGRRGGTPIAGRTGSGSPAAGPGGGRIPRGGLLGRMTGGRLGTHPSSSGASSGVRPGTSPAKGGLLGRLTGRRSTSRPGAAGGTGGGPTSPRGRGGLLGRLTGASRRGGPAATGPRTPAGRRPAAGAGPIGTSPASPPRRGLMAKARGVGADFMTGYRHGARGRPPVATPKAPIVTPKTPEAPRPPAAPQAKRTDKTDAKPPTAEPIAPKTPDKGESNRGGTMPATDNPNGRPAPDDQSLFAFGEGLRAAPGHFEEFASRIDAWARQAAETQPISEAVVDQMKAAAGVVRAIGGDAAAWYGSYRRGNAPDIARVETPRKGSHAVEEKADVTAYRRDH